MKMICLFLCLACAGCLSNRRVLATWPDGSPRWVKITRGDCTRELDYYPNGTLRFSSPRDANKAFHGKLLGFWSDGSPREESHWHHGIILRGKYWDADGKLLSEVVDGTGKRQLFLRGEAVAYELYRDGRQIGGGKK